MSSTRCPSPAAAPWLLPALLVLFFLSGLSALIYQVLWLRLLGLVFGVTTYAASTVLGAFMAGLALGSLVAGRVADRVRSPLAWFGGAELGIGLLALGTPLALGAAGRLYAAIHGSAADSLGVLTLARFVCSFLVLLVPTALMGASLPLVVRSSLVSLGGLGPRVSLLYGTNTAGAILGVWLAGYHLIGGIGIRRSFELAAAVNVLVGLTALVLARWLRGPAERVPREAPAEPPLDTGYGAATRYVVLGVFAVSGLVSLALEVVWFRALILFLEATTYAFTTMLATVLAGIAAGSCLAALLLLRRCDWLVLLAGIELLTGSAAILSLSVLNRLYRAGWTTNEAIGASTLVILPAALLLGLAFPVGLSLWTSGAADADRKAASRIGVFYSLNVCGAILGALLSGFFLLGWLGTRRSLLVVAAVSLAGGLALLVPLGWRRPRVALVLGVAGVALFGLAAASLEDPFSAVLGRRYPGETLLWREEGPQTTVSVHDAGGAMKVMYLDGLHQANDTAPMVYAHEQIGLLPLALHPRPADVLVVGLGGGATGGGVAHDREARIDLVELSAAVVRGSRFFTHVNGDVLSRPNVRLRVDDGRNFMALSGKRYDVITADIIEPFHAGAGNLYSREYFELARRALKDDGLMLQWVGRRAATHWRLIVRTYQSVFPDATLWANGTLLVGSRRPLSFSRHDFDRKLRDPELRAAFESVGIGSFDDLRALYTAGPEELRAFVGEGPLLTDDRPAVEYYLSLPPDRTPIDVTGLRGDVSRHVREADPGGA